MLPITTHEIKLYDLDKYEIEVKVKPSTIVEASVDNNFSFSYCVAYRDPNEPEWILARGFWNDQGIWTNDDIWNDF